MKAMRKRGICMILVGEMYNAVIDIWKTGVEKLGVKSKNYDNIKKAAKYTYTY